MPQIWRVTADWPGGKIGTGYTNMFFNAGVSTAQLASDAVRKFISDSYTSGGYLPTGVNIAFRSVVDVLEEVNGELVSQLAVTAPAAIAGGDPGRYSAVSGACVSWRTGDFVNGHRVRGRTFLVPMGALGLATDGSLDNLTVTNINTAAAGLVAAAPELVIWRRPTSHAASDGSSHIVGTGVCQDKAAYLTSRR